MSKTSSQNKLKRQVDDLPLYSFSACLDLDMSVTKLGTKNSNCEIITPSGLALALETLCQGITPLQSLIIFPQMHIQKAKTACIPARKILMESEL